MRAVYRKIHLFDVTVDGTNYGEAATQEAGEEIVVSTLASGLSQGMTICYDLRFPELYRIHPGGRREVRRRLPALTHRRPSAYQWGGG